MCHMLSVSGGLVPPAVFGLVPMLCCIWQDMCAFGVCWHGHLLYLCHYCVSVMHH